MSDIEPVRSPVTLREKLGVSLSDADGDVTPDAVKLTVARADETVEEKNGTSR